jgi:hypothetical protein
MLGIEPLHRRGTALEPGALIDVALVGSSLPSIEAGAVISIARPIRSRRSTAISRASHSILRKAGLVSTAAAFPLMSLLPKPWSVADASCYRRI